MMRQDGDGGGAESKPSYPFNHEIEHGSYLHKTYRLTVRQQPERARLCSFKDKVDRRPIDPPPIVQLQVPEDTNEDYLQNPYYFVHATIVTPDGYQEVNPVNGNHTTAGTVVQSLHRLKYTDDTDGGFFIFPEMSVRVEGKFRIKFSLFEIVGLEVVKLQTEFSDIFTVYAPKSFPGMAESTFLTRLFSDQGVRTRIRKENRAKQAIGNGGGGRRKRTEEEDSYGSDGSRSQSSKRTHTPNSGCSLSPSPSNLSTISSSPTRSGIEQTPVPEELYWSNRPYAQPQCLTFDKQSATVEGDFLLPRPGHTSLIQLRDVEERTLFSNYARQHVITSQAGSMSAADGTGGREWIGYPTGLPPVPLRYPLEMARKASPRSDSAQGPYPVKIGFRPPRSRTSPRQGFREARRRPSAGWEVTKSAQESRTTTSLSLGSNPYDTPSTVAMVGTRTPGANFNRHPTFLNNRGYYLPPPLSRGSASGKYQ